VGGFCLEVSEGRKRKSDESQERCRGIENESQKDTGIVKSAFAFVLHRIGLGTEVFEKTDMRRSNFRIVELDSADARITKTYRNVILRETRA
jgi:hypothetical protein